MTPCQLVLSTLHTKLTPLVSSHTFSLINAQQERFWVKWHLKSKQGIKNLSRAEAARLAGSDPDYAQRDLFAAIARED